MISCSWFARCPGLKISFEALLLLFLAPRHLHGFNVFAKSRGRLGSGLGGASRYYDVITQKNETVDYFGESTWADLVPRDNVALPPLDIKQEFKQPAPPPAEEQVFCSRTLNMRAIKAIGYDMDYTLVQYKWEKWEALAYECTKGVLAGYGFPVDDLSFDNPELVCRGLVIDKQLGNFLKLDRHGFVRRAMHGYKQLSATEIDDHYGRFVVDLRLNRFSFLNTLFSVSEGVLYAQLVNKLDTGALFDDAVSPFDPSKVDTYATLYRAVSKALSRAHTHGASSLKARVVEDPAAFTQREPEKLRAMLADQRNAGKKLALITNSDWWYTDTMMKYVTGDDPDWRKLFDVVFVSARKPSFFTPDRLPCYELVVEQNKSVTPLLREIIGACKIGGVYCGGSAYLVEKMFGLSEDELLYIGDHVLHDVNSVKSSMRWRTMLVVQELQAEISAFRAEHRERRTLNTLLDRKDELAVKLNHLRCHLRRREQLRFEGREDSSDDAVDGECDVTTSCQQSIAAILHAMTALDSQIEPRLKLDGGEFNTHWGYISRTGQDKSIYQRMIEKSCDIYTSKITNLLAYTPYHYFRAAPQALAHEPPSQIDADHDLHIDDREERYI